MSSKKNQGGDERFHRVQKDPRFWEMPERERKIKIDKRFHSMFHDSRFKVKYTVDKRGRPINQTSTEDLKRFYNISDSGDDEEEEEEEGGRSKKEGKQKKKGKEKLVKNGRAVQRSDGGEPPGRGVVVTGEGQWMFLMQAEHRSKSLLVCNIWKSCFHVSSNDSTTRFPSKTNHVIRSKYE